MNPNLPTSISPLRSFSARAKPDTINMGLGKPHEDMPPALRDLAAGLLENSSLRMDYSENAGFKAVRTLLERHYRLPEGSSLLTHGAQEGLFSALLAVLSPGDEVLIPNPGFLAYGPIVKALQAKPVLYPLERSKGAFAYSLEAIRKSVSKRTRVILLNAPGNPTGSMVSAEFIRELSREFPRVQIVSDEVYGELHFQDPYIPFCRYGKNIITVNAFSKSHALTGWRIGWVASGDSRVMGKILVAHQYVTTCASVPAQHLVGALLSDSELFDSIRDRYVAEYLSRRNEFFRNLEEVAQELSLPEAGFYAFLPIPKRFSGSLAFAEHLLEKKNVLVIPGEFFGSRGKKFVRVSYATSLEHAKKAAQAILACYR